MGIILSGYAGLLSEKKKHGRIPGKNPERIFEWTPARISGAMPSGFSGWNLEEMSGHIHVGIFNGIKPTHPTWNRIKW